MYIYCVIVKKLLMRPSVFSNICHAAVILFAVVFVSSCVIHRVPSRPVPPPPAEGHHYGRPEPKPLPPGHDRKKKKPDKHKKHKHAGEKGPHGAGVFMYVY